MNCEQRICVEKEGCEQEISIEKEGCEQDINVFKECLTVTEITSYNRLYDKPKINGVTLEGDKSSSEIHVQHEMDDITNQMIDDIIYA